MSGCHPSGGAGRDVAPDAGVATVFAAFGLLVLLLVGGAGVQIGAAVVARHRVQAAADLAALAGAAAGVAPEGEDPCTAAGSVAQRNHGAMTDCRLDGIDVVVRVEAPVTVLGTAVAQARAGPV
ncbi:flp pilus-assembly TadE/G-like family protein [Rhodococcus sp. D2-41]|uniref:Flp pilus-assembly TadE/G-like family protein n=1 Tax=Speluncibacter jeojiensis TaxID=2710754 RepID=A0A9X4RJD6_9ACTN|nr:Rv3654c family TadE-like protein [Rhodococcus sp. D2-41]MDG3009369.1 flp pilus-assembly TadE/G-like family protein [Rhodococcus sp. D2-41]MDG3017076.1 flp pilus-assembly TadE/G-like family protein [Corynebacteriales bacterium D3-21]